jgi:hypothetical protein
MYVLYGIIQYFGLPQEHLQVFELNTKVSLNQVRHLSIHKPVEVGLECAVATNDWD